jgi:hypothetical protein
MMVYVEGKMEEHKRSGGIGFCGLLALVFIVLKLTKGLLLNKVDN